MVDLTPDCSNCAALCCVALAFDHSDMFAFGKAAGEACRHLSDEFKCVIHPQLKNAGFKGCTLYQCNGAGQRVVQEVFAGQNWRETPDLLPDMLIAFAQMRQMHELEILLEEALTLPLKRGNILRLSELKKALGAERLASKHNLQEFENSGIRTEIKIFLRSLQGDLSDKL